MYIILYSIFLASSINMSPHYYTASQYLCQDNFMQGTTQIVLNNNENMIITITAITGVTEVGHSTNML